MLFTFPSRYWFAIGLSGVFSLTGWSRRIRAEFLVLRVTQDTTKPHLASVTGLSPAMVELSRTFFSLSVCYAVVLLPRICVATHTVWALPRSLAATRGIDVSFSSWGYLDVSVHPVPFSQAIDSPVDTCALPQVRSRIRRSVDITDMCSSPQLIAACHVLLRLPVPRHPPYALIRLTFALGHLI